MPRGKKGRPVLGAFAGFFFGLLLAIDLLIFSAITLDSVLIIVLPILFMTVGIAVPLVRRAIANRPQEPVETQGRVDPYIPHQEVPVAAEEVPEAAPETEDPPPTTI